MLSVATSSPTHPPALLFPLQPITPNHPGKMAARTYVNKMELVTMFIRQRTNAISIRFRPIFCVSSQEVIMLLACQTTFSVTMVYVFLKTGSVMETMIAEICLMKTRRNLLVVSIMAKFVCQNNVLYCNVEPLARTSLSRVISIVTRGRSIVCMCVGVYVYRNFGF